MMSNQSGGDNWLQSRHIECPQCHYPWLKMHHPPTCDDYTLYCDSCARSAEVSFYDSGFQQLATELWRNDDHSYASLMSAIEQRLKFCSCGGRFRHDSPRRCAICMAILVDGESGVDLIPLIYDREAEDRDPTPEECDRYAEFEQLAPARKDDLWRTQ